MRGAELWPLLPFLILGGTIVAGLLWLALTSGREGVFLINAIGVMLALAVLIRMPMSGPEEVAPLLKLDAYARFYVALSLAGTLTVAVLSRGYFRKQAGGHRGEYDLLLLIGAFGSAILAASSHFATFFLGLEILSVALYVLISFQEARPRGLEAGIKYLVLAGSSSAILLFGMALVYSAYGSMEFVQIRSKMHADGVANLLSSVGLTLILVGVGFKLALAPFHMWSPDVYEGAPAPVTAFVATVSKGAMFALLFRYVSDLDLRNHQGIFLVISELAFLSMTVGNFLALFQENLKRLLAYSSIAHLGYLLVALLSGREIGPSAAAFYLLTYMMTTLAAFGFVSFLSGKERDADRVDDYRGLFWTRPWIAMGFTIALLSLAGIPLTAGFVGKVFLITSAIDAALWPLAFVLIINSAVSLFYYLRVIVTMIGPLPEGIPEEREVTVRSWTQGIGSRIVLITLITLTIGLGTYPSPVMVLIQTAMKNNGR